jgi:glycosyltransferase involved in cell wall biosynthesis
MVQAANDARVRYVRNPQRRGFAGNFSECLRQARGDLIKFLNDDDQLAPHCVSELAAAIGRYPHVHLATSRRVVIDANGEAAPDRPSTTPVALANCVIDGRDFGNLLLVNVVNLIGEPSTVLFRKSVIAGEIDPRNLFSWNGREYHCLADVSLWMRLLCRGSVYYHAAALSNYRVHPGQEQKKDPMVVSCMAEWLAMTDVARGLGFLAIPGQAEHAYRRMHDWTGQFLARVKLTDEQRGALERLRADCERRIGGH